MDVNADAEQKKLAQLSSADFCEFVLYVADGVPQCAPCVRLAELHPHDIHVQDVRELDKASIPGWLQGVPTLVTRSTKSVQTGAAEIVETLEASLNALPQAAAGMGGGISSGDTPSTFAKFEDGQAFTVGAGTALSPMPQSDPTHEGTRGPTRARGMPEANLPPAVSAASERPQRLSTQDVEAYMMQRSATVPPQPVA